MPIGHGASPNVGEVAAGKSTAAVNSRGAGKAVPSGMAIPLNPYCQEKPRSQSGWRPYRNPTQVGSPKTDKVDERTLVKELGKMTP